MNRFISNKDNDLVPMTDGDGGFVGVNSKIERAYLPQTFAAAARNKRFRRGVAETREGMVCPVALNQVREPIFGAGVYSDPHAVPFDGDESRPGGLSWLMLAVERGVWLCRDDRPPRWVAFFEVDELNDGPVELAQCFDKVLMLRGKERRPLQWDGTRYGRFEPVTTEGLGNGIDAIPNAESGVTLQNRLLLLTGFDEVPVSDVLDYTRYDAILNVFRVNSGTGERITALFPYGSTALLVFKEHSTWIVAGLEGDWAENATQSLLDARLGCAARRSVAQVGGDVFFLDRAGVFRVSTVLQKTQTVAAPVSDPIEPLIRRINWPHAGGACAAVWGEYYFLAVPLDQSTANNAVLVFNTVSGNWEGMDAAAFPLAIDQFFTLDYLGEPRLMALDRKARRVFVLGEGPEDIADGAASDIADMLETRGYTLGQPVDFKKFQGCQVAMATWNPRTTIETLTDGQAESATLRRDITRDRCRHLQFGRAEWKSDNRHDDQRAPGRLDYTLIPNGVYCGTGLRLDLTQEFIETHSVRAMGRWLALRITNTRGRCGVRATLADGKATRTSRMKA